MALSEFDQAYDASMAAVTAPGGQLALGRAQVRGVEYPVFVNAPPALRDYAALFLAANADKEFLVYEGERYTFADVQRQATKMAAMLQARHGIAKGDRVAIAMRNYPEWITAFLGATMLGAVLVPLNAWWTADALRYGLQHSGARLVFADAERLQLIGDLDGQALVKVAVRTDAELAAANGADPLAAALAASPDVPDFLPPVHADDDCMLMYTSGSTGTPKGAISTQQAVVAATLNYLALGLALLGMAEKSGKALPAQQVMLLHVPLFHITGLLTLFLVSIASGRKMVIMYRWDAGEALKLIEREKCTYFVGVPTMSLELMQHPDRDKYDLSSLTDIAGGGSPRPPEHVKRLEKAFPGRGLTLGYGLTETNGVGVGNFGESYLARPDSTGRFTGPLSEIGIFHDDMTPVAAGAVGEVCVRSVANARGYWRNPRATAEAFTADGWFRTGDLGRRDADGYVYIVDRKKDIIIRGGENISAVEVEDAIYADAAVAEAAVFGLPDERLGELVGAVVYGKGGQPLDAAALGKFLDQRLERFKLPAKIWVVTEPLPKLGSGKIDKVSLRQLYRPKWNAAADA